jgi:hypothetical protein
MTPSARPRRRLPVSATLVLALAALLGVQASLARITRNTIDPVATVGLHGRQVTLTGRIEVLPAGGMVFLRVTVTQRSTGAIAEGIAFLAGTGAVQQWRVRAFALTRDRFEEGPPIAVALARSTAAAEGTDAHQWLVDVTLVRA